MTELDLKPILESLLFVSNVPLKLETLREVLSEWSEEEILSEIRRIQEEYREESRGIELLEVAGGYQFRTKPKYAQWISRLRKDKPVKLSQSALETLAIIAYRQPIIRSKIEEIRGVDSGWVLRTLLEKDLIKIMGRKEIPGKPIVYGTSQRFLELFNLKSLDDLPNLKEVQPTPFTEHSPKEGETFPPSEGEE
ncbi:MAG: SMC-Scp complex subunit ScpB [Thermodesulfobacteriota bacterium]